MRFPAQEVEVAIKTILFATDFSDASDSAQDYALALSRHHGSKLITAHVQSPTPFQMVPPEASGFVADQLESIAEKEMKLWAARLDKAGIVHKEAMPIGAISECLAFELEISKADLLVM